MDHRFSFSVKNSIWIKTDFSDKHKELLYRRNSFNKTINLLFYKLFAKRLLKHVFGVSGVENGIELKVLKHMFGLEKAELG